MYIDLQCQSLTERIFRKLDTIDWDAYAEQVVSIEQEKNEKNRNTTVTYADGFSVSTYERRTTDGNGSEYFYGPRTQYTFPLEMNGERYQVVANKEWDDYSFTLLEGGAKLAQASGGDCNNMEITAAEKISAQLLEAALSTLTGMEAHVREDKYILEANN